MKEERGVGGVDVICREMISFIQAERGREGGRGWMLHILISQGYLGSFTLVTLV